MRHIVREWNAYISSVCVFEIDIGADNLFVVVCLWETGEFCLTLNNEVIMSNLGATAIF